MSRRDIAELVGNYNDKLVEWDVPKLLLYAEPGALLQRPAVEWCEVHLKNLTSINLGTGKAFPSGRPPARYRRSACGVVSGALICLSDRTRLSFIVDGDESEFAFGYFQPLAHPVAQHPRLHMDRH